MSASLGQNLFFGLKSGLNLNSIHQSGFQEGTLPRKNDYVGVNASTWIGYKIDNKTRLSFEPGYILKGAAFEGSSDVLRLHYVDMPLLFEYLIAKNVNLVVGPNLSYLLNAKISSESENSVVNDLYNKKAEISGVLGLSYDVSFFMDIGVRYNMGFSNISDITLINDVGAPYGQIHEKNRYLQFLIRLKIAN